MNKYFDNYEPRMKNTFIGFSTVASDKKRNYKLHDRDLIKQDLLNHFHTRIGERVMRPEYGCRVWDYLMEPFTTTIKDQTVREVTRIIETDPRVEIVELYVSAYKHGLRVEAVLDYQPLGERDQFRIDFENRQLTS